MLSFFPRGVLDEILNLIESVSEDFLPTLSLAETFRTDPHNEYLSVLKRKLSVLKCFYR